MYLNNQFELLRHMESDGPLVEGPPNSGQFKCNWCPNLDDFAKLSIVRVKYTIKEGTPAAKWDHRDNYRVPVWRVHI